MAAPEGEVRELASALAGAKVGQLAPTWPPAPKTRRPHEFGVFVRSEGQVERAKAAVSLAGLP